MFVLAGWVVVVVRWTRAVEGCWALNGFDGLFQYVVLGAACNNVHMFARRMSLGEERARTVIYGAYLMSFARGEVYVVGGRLGGSKGIDFIL